MIGQKILTPSISSYIWTLALLFFFFFPNQSYSLVKLHMNLSQLLVAIEALRLLMHFLVTYYNPKLATLIFEAMLLLPCCQVLFPGFSCSQLCFPCILYPFYLSAIYKGSPSMPNLTHTPPLQHPGQIQWPLVIFPA